jgi:energy-coupling factor transporter transmembrane protein EcfT
MAYRYIFLLLTSVTDMYQARQARTPGTPKHDRSARAFLGASVGTLLGKASQLSEEVHQAMTARGYRGDAKTLEHRRPRAIDAYYIVSVVIFAAVMLIGDHLLVR